jgi:ApaG protein
MSTSSDFLELPGLRVNIDRVQFEPEVQTPPDRPYCFVYYITIRNNSELAVTIKGRKWVVTSPDGEVTAVEGDGVVGEHPELQPGQHFSYNSYHLLSTHSAVAEGSYIGLDALGRKVLVRIPRFAMIVPPQARHSS